MDYKEAGVDVEAGYSSQINERTCVKAHDKNVLVTWLIWRFML